MKQERGLEVIRSGRGIDILDSVVRKASLRRWLLRKGSEGARQVVVWEKGIPGRGAACTMALRQEYAWVFLEQQETIWLE